MSLQCLSTINMVFSDEDKILIRSLYLKGTQQRGSQTNFLRNAETKGGVNKLLKRCETQAQLQAARNLNF